MADKITVRLNGQQVSQLKNANRSAKGYIGLQNHHAGSAVQFARLRIKKLAAQPAAGVAVPTSAARRGIPLNA